MKSIELKNLILYGELAMRTNMNFARLETEKYWPETIFEMDKNSWPGDWEGRTILALTMLAQSTKREPAFLDEIISRIPDRLNEKGYLGPVYPEGVTHEQAMSGHNWLIRGLCEYYNWKKKTNPALAKTALGILKGVINGLYIPQAENYRNYPIDENTRYNDPYWILSAAVDPNHKKAGKNPAVKKHAGKTDYGCAFIAIDGATAAYELLKQDSLKPLIEAMIDSYKTLPREQLHVQTHATLSGIRGILRFYRITGEKKYLTIAINVFDLYKTKAWTAHYANYNWFGLPRWTEPCAIIDSFIISQELWEITGKETYLIDAHHILYNAIAHAERTTGAFGTDLCTGVKISAAQKEGTPGGREPGKAILFVKALIYEVFWCCNMRGGDGLSCAGMYTFYTEDNTVTMPYFHSCTATVKLKNGTLTLQEKANYPFSGKVTLTVLKSSAGTVTLRFFAPKQYTDGAKSELFINGVKQKTVFKNGFIEATAKLKQNDEICFNSNIKFFSFDAHPCINTSKEHFSFHHGPMMLGIRTTIKSPDEEVKEYVISREAEAIPVGAGRYQIKTKTGQTVLLQPMWGKENMIEPLDVFQVLFKK